MHLCNLFFPRVILFISSSFLIYGGLRVGVFLLLGSQIGFLGFLVHGIWGLLCGNFKYFEVGAFYIRRINLEMKMVQPAHSIIVMLIIVTWLFVLRLPISSELSLSWAVTLSVSPPDIYVRLCGFGVALSAETEIGQFRSDRVCRSGHKHVEICSPRWDPNPQSHNWQADALPTEPRQLLII